MKNFLKRILPCTIAGIMLIMNAPKISITKAESTSPTIPKYIFAAKSDLDTTWSKNGDGTNEAPGGSNQYILFGHYPQSKITDVSGLTENVDYTVLNNEYFKIEPIKWRILENNNGKLFLMSNNGLDANKPFLYNGGQYKFHNATWKYSDLRKWLNGESTSDYSEIVPENGDASSIPSDKYSNGFTNLISGKFGEEGFLQSAFTSIEQNKISAENLTFSHCLADDINNYTWTSESLNNQKIFVLSSDHTNDNSSNDSELRNPNYGFINTISASPTRKFKITDYAKSNNGYEESEYGSLWTRTSIYISSDACAYAGFVYFDGSLTGAYAYFDGPAVAPAFKMDMSSVSFASAANATSTANFEEISGIPAMTLRFNSSGTDLENTEITKTGSTVNYANAPSGSSLVVVSTNSEGKNYQYRQALENTNGSINLTSKEGFTERVTYEAWVEKENDGLLYASNPAAEPTNPSVEAFEQWVTANFNGNPNHRFGIKTDTSVIAKDSTFYVETVDKNNPQYNDFLSQLDKNINIENIKFLKIGVRKSDGTEYTDLAKPVEVYIQWPEGWDENDQLLVHLSTGEDVPRKFLRWENIDGIEYAVYEFSSFSPYALLDLLNDQEKNELGLNAEATGDNSAIWITLIIVLILASGLVFIITKRKKK